MILYSADGKQLWREKRTDKGESRWISKITMVEKWDDRPGDYVLGYARGGSILPTLYDGYGKPVATFPMPDSESMTKLAQHADMCGDDREEIVVYDEDAVYIYRNDAVYLDAKYPQKRPQTKRLHNYTAYLGMP